MCLISRIVVVVGSASQDIGSIIKSELHTHILRCKIIMQWSQNLFDRADCCGSCFSELGIGSIIYHRKTNIGYGRY